ncbi:MAG: hypothetical protein ACXAC2_09535 [Candidatus Kariarchaeaceae archaeon]|jgi:hypothetical protein
MNLLKNNQPVIVSLTLLFVIILSSMPTTSVMSILLNDSTQDETAGVETLRGAKVEVSRLMKRRTSKLSNFVDNSSSGLIDGSYSYPKFAIGECCH